MSRIDKAVKLNSRLVKRGFLLFCALQGVDCSTNLAQSWEMYQSNPEHNAVLPSTGWSARWRLPLHAKVNGGLALSGTSLIIGTFGNEVFRVDARLGEVVWRSKLDNIIMSTPIVRDNVVVVGTGHNGRIGGDPSHVYEDDAPPAVWGRQEGDSIVALDVRSGRQIWSLPTVGEDMPSPVLLKDELVFANGDLHAYALNIEDGKLLWSRAVPGVATMASANFSMGSVFVSTCTSGPYVCETTAIKPGDGSTVWSSPYGDEDSAPTVGAGSLLLSGFTVFGCRKSTAASTVTAVAVNTGSPIWKWRSKTCGKFTSNESNERAITGMYSDGIYYQASALENSVYAFDVSTGRLIWTTRTAGRTKMSPITKDGRLFFGDSAGYLYVLDSHSGKLLGRRLFPEAFTTSPPILLGDTMFIASNGSVYAISPKSLEM